jgi:hypothetical protein
MNEITDKDLPPIARTEANYWRAEALKYRLELAAQTRGQARLAKRNEKFQEEIMRLNEENERLTELLSPKFPPPEVI